MKRIAAIFNNITKPCSRRERGIKYLTNGLCLFFSWHILRKAFFNVRHGSLNSS